MNVQVLDSDVRETSQLGPGVVIRLLDRSWIPIHNVIALRIFIQRRNPLVPPINDQKCDRAQILPDQLSRTPDPRPGPAYDWEFESLKSGVTP